MEARVGRWEDIGNLPLRGKCDRNNNNNSIVAFTGLEKTRLREILKQRMSIDQKPLLPPLIAMPKPIPISSADAAEASSLSMSTGNQQQDGAETTPQFRPRSHYAQPYYQSTSNSMAAAPETMGRNPSPNHLPSQQQQQQSHGYDQSGAAGSSATPPPPPPSRATNNSGDQNAAGTGSRRLYGMNGGLAMSSDSPVDSYPGARPSFAHRSSFSQQRMQPSSQAAYPRAGNEDGATGGGNAGPPRRESGSRPNRHNQYAMASANGDAELPMINSNLKLVSCDSTALMQQVTQLQSSRSADQVVRTSTTAGRP